VEKRKVAPYKKQTAARKKIGIHLLLEMGEIAILQGRSYG